MKKQIKLCPFKKKIKRCFPRDIHRNLDIVITERLDTCAGERCMAYSDGKCLRLSGKEA
jgi:hypothetical protein